MENTPKPKTARLPQPAIDANRLIRMDLEEIKLCVQSYLDEANQLNRDELTVQNLQRMMKIARDIKKQCNDFEHTLVVIRNLIVMGGGA